MNFSEIRSKIKNGVYDAPVIDLPVRYPPGYVFDRFKSVDWNEKETERLNSKWDEVAAQNEKARSDADERFKKDLIQLIMDSTGINAADCAEKIFAFAYETRQDRGLQYPDNLYGILKRAEELASLYHDIKSASKPMCFDTIQKNLLYGVYEPCVMAVPPIYQEGHIFDNNKSGAWNKKQVERLNGERELTIAFNAKAVEDAESNFKRDLIGAIRNTGRFTEEMVVLIYAKAYNDGHTCGNYKVFEIA